MSQKRQKWDFFVLSMESYLNVLSRSKSWMIWKCHGIPCFHFYFLFRNSVKREQLDEKEFCRCYGNLFSQVSFWKYKVLCRRLRDALKTAFEGHFTVEDFPDMNQQRCRACSSQNIAPRHLTYYCMLLFLSHKPAF